MQDILTPTRLGVCERLHNEHSWKFPEKAIRLYPYLNVKAWPASLSFKYWNLIVIIMIV